MKRQHEVIVNDQNISDLKNQLAARVLEIDALRKAGRELEARYKVLETKYNEARREVSALKEVSTAPLGECETIDALRQELNIMRQGAADLATKCNTRAREHKSKAAGAVRQLDMYRTDHQSEVEFWKDKCTEATKSHFAGKGGVHDTVKVDGLENIYSEEGIGIH